MLWFTGRCSWGRRSRAALFLSAFLLGAAPGAAWAADPFTMPGILSPGDAVVTGFSGLLPPPEDMPEGSDPLAFTFINPDGPSMQVERLLPSGPPSGQLIESPATFTAAARDVGQVFAITLDDTPAPNIYLGATSAFGIHIVAPGEDGALRHVRQGLPGAQFMDGQWGTAKGGAPGSIYKVDGKTGEVSLFTSIGTNAGPGLGDVVFDRASRQFFASDLDTGLIYRLDETGLIADTFDHGATGRPAKGLGPVADDGSRMDIAKPAFNSEDPATWGLTPLERRVGGMAVHGGRLYYAVADGPQVWSIGIGLDGSFRGDPRWEIDVSEPEAVTDIAFDSAGRIILAQRGAQQGSYDDSVFAAPKAAAVLRYKREIPDDPATPGTWVPVPDEYAIGFRPELRNTNGGVSLGYAYDSNGYMQTGTCNAFLWTTGEALRDDPALESQLAAGGPATVDGLQGNDASLVRPENAPPFNAYFTDYDGDTDHPERQGWLGDVEVFQPCSSKAQGYLGYPGYLPPPVYLPPGRPEGNFNLTLDKESSPRVCIPGGLGWLCYYTIRVTNTGTEPYWGPITVRDWMPDARPGTIVGFDIQPPWLCAEVGPWDNECTLPGAFLFPGEAVELYVTVNQPRPAVDGDLCYAGNGAELLWWEDWWDSNSWDDFDYAEARIPDERCNPQGGTTNLTVSKRAVHQDCKIVGPDWKCDYLITVVNTGPGVYSGPISVDDAVQVPGPILYGPQPNPPAWTCVPAGGGHYACDHAPVVLNPGQGVDLWVSAKIPVAEQEANDRCTLENRVRITGAPGGSPGNTDPGDDSASAEAKTRGANCKPHLGIENDLSITKEPAGCGFMLGGGGGYVCYWTIKVKNEGPGHFTGTVTVHDTPSLSSTNGYAPWACAAVPGGFDCSLDFSGAPLAPGETRTLNAGTVIDKNSQICEVSNQAKITAPAGGTPHNTNGGNDDSGVVSQPVPSPQCNPEPASNLKIEKRALGCQGGGTQTNAAALAQAPGITCGFEITVTNEGPADVAGDVGFFDIHDVVGPTTYPSVAPGWSCGNVGLISGCGTAAGLANGATATFQVEMKTTAAQVRKHQCKVQNLAVIAVPVGAPKNTVAPDDASLAVADGPPQLCNELKLMDQTFCPAERQMPDQGCCPDGQRWNGRECSGGKVTTKPVPKVCPKGTVGTYPDCRKVRVKTCPPNTTGKYPDCRPITVKSCPSDSVGKYPNCTCKRGTYGTPGECRKRTPRECPKGTVGKWPNCEEIRKVCPKGTVGKWPNCEEIRQVCPKGTVGKWPNCERIRQVCPKGTVGTWPNCERIRQKCPKGTAGTWPNCETIQRECPRGTVGNWPNCVKRPVTTGCPEGKVYSKRAQGCVSVQTEPQQELKLRAPIIKINPNLLNPQTEMPQ